MKDSEVKIQQPSDGYRGRIAPTPTGLLHLGHVATFYRAWERCRTAGGTLIYRNEDIDIDRCKPEFAEAGMADLRAVGIDWDHGPNTNKGPDAPYDQSTRHQRGDYLEVWRQLLVAGLIYPSPQSRKKIAAHGRPSRSGDELLFPTQWRSQAPQQSTKPGPVNWRFRVPDGAAITFQDRAMGPQRFVAGEDFGDFLIWRKDGWPAYELAVVADDIAMQISEVVRGADLLLSTARQLLIYQALGATPPAFYHCPLILGPDGKRLAKRAGSLGIRALLEKGKTPQEILAQALPAPSA